MFLQSGRAADRHRAADPDEFPRPCIKNLFILEIKNLLADFHDSPFNGLQRWNFAPIYYRIMANGTVKSHDKQGAMLYVSSEIIMKDDSYWMGRALNLARKAESIAEVPIGAVIVRDGTIIGRGFNQRESRNDPSAHAEMIAIRQASRKLDAWRLTGTTLYVTLEPCPMCMGAILLARIERVVFGCFRSQGGCCRLALQPGGRPPFQPSDRAHQRHPQQECLHC